MIARAGARRTWLPVLQAACSLALLAWLVSRIHWPELWATISQASPPLIAVGCCVYYLGVLLSSLKWRIALQVEEIELPLARLLPWYLIGAFASNFLPSDIGGDLGRGFIAGRATGRPLAIARSIFVERLSGLTMMLALGWLGALALPAYRRWALLTLALALVAGLAGLLIWQVMPRQRLSDLRARLPARLRIALAESRAVVERYWRRPDLLAVVLLISLTFQAMAGFGLWLNLRAVGVALPLLPVMLVGMMVGIIGLLPISVNGWGLREATIIALLAPLGASTVGVLAGALLGRALVLVLSLVGGPLLLFERQSAPLES